mmetsp:Transcript_35262/g.69498  ORF Transcript_35262/g.69498 Transcript_35262/m.69498 type:complete len:985 (-) Transcript_35262:96-3050(-)
MKTGDRLDFHEPIPLSKTDTFKFVTNSRSFSHSPRDGDMNSLISHPNCVSPSPLPASVQLEEALVRVSELTKKYWRAQEIAEKERQARFALENELRQKNDDLSKERALKEALDTDLQEKNHDIISLRKEIHQNQTDHENYSKIMLQQHSQENDNHKIKFERLNSSNEYLTKRFENLTANMETSKSNISNLEHQLFEKENEFTRCKIELNQIREDLKDKEDLLERTNTNQGELERKFSTLKLHSESLLSKLDLCKEELRQTENDLNKSKATLAKKNHVVIANENLILQKNDELDTCQSQLTQMQAKNKIHIKLLEEMNLTNDDYKREVSDLSSEHAVVLDNLNKTRQELLKATNERTLLQNNISEFENILKNKENEELSKIKENYQQDMDLLRTECVALKDDYDKNVSKITEVNQSLDSSLRELKYDLAGTKREKDDLDQSFHKKEAEFKSALQQKDKQLRDNESLIFDLENERKDHLVKIKENQTQENAYKKEILELSSSNKLLLTKSDELLDNQRKAEKKILSTESRLVLREKSYILLAEEQLRKKENELGVCELKLQEMDVNYQNLVGLYEEAKAEKEDCKRNINELTMQLGKAKNVLSSMKNELLRLRVSSVEKEKNTKCALEKKLAQKNEAFEICQIKLHTEQSEKRCLELKWEHAQKEKADFVEQIGTLSSSKFDLLKKKDNLERQANLDRMTINSMENELEAERFPPESTYTRIMILCERVNDNHKKMIKKIGGVLVHRVEDASTATHVIAGNDVSSIRRTSKLMVALSCTENILHMDWLAHSARANKILPCKNYLLLFDKKSEKEQNVSMRETLRNGRACRRNGGLLFGWSIYFCAGIAGTSAPPESELELIITSAGGVFLREISLDSYPETIIIISSDPVTEDQKEEENVALVAQEGNGYFTSSWLFQCVMTQHLSFKSRKKRSSSSNSPYAESKSAERKLRGSLSCASSMCSIDSSKSGCTNKSGYTRISRMKQY